MYIVALTGGIGSGKSEAAKQFSRLGVPVVDTDAISHELTTNSSPMVTKIAQAFGTQFLNADGALNRAKLRTQVFNTPAERLKLEALMHPAIYEQAIELLNNNAQILHPAYQILVVPLLFESNRFQTIVNKILLIDCEEDLQIERVMTRSEMNQQEVSAMMNAQTTRANRIKLADAVIENNGSLEALIEKVNEFHNKTIKNH